MIAHISPNFHIVLPERKVHSKNRLIEVMLMYEPSNEVTHGIVQPEGILDAMTTMLWQPQIHSTATTKLENLRWSGKNVVVKARKCVTSISSDEAQHKQTVDIIQGTYLDTWRQNGNAWILITSQPTLVTLTIR